MYLFKRVIDGQVSDLQKMLGLSEVKVNDKDESKMTPLHYAAWYNKPEVVSTLLQHGADIHAKDVHNATPLHYAARYKQRTFQTATGEEIVSPSSKKVIQVLVEAGSDVNSQDCYGDTPLFFGVLRGNEDAVEELLSVPETNIQITDNRGLTALHVASKFNRISIAKMLVDHGADIRKESDRKMTALHFACMEGNNTIAQMVLDAAGEDASELINAENVDGESPLDLAIENRKFATCELCLEAGAKVRKTCRQIASSPLHIAATAGDVQICRMLLDKDKHLVKMHNTMHAIPLHRAAQYDRGDVVELLLERISNAEARDEDNSTPLLTAAASGSNHALKALLKAGANISVINKADQSAIHMAAKTNRKDTIKILLDCIEKKGVLDTMISSDDRMGNSPLHLAAEQGFTGIVQTLLKHGADITNKNEDEETALHVAAKCGMITVVKALLSQTRDPTIINDTEEDSNTPLHLAASEGHAKVVEELLAAGADIGHRNRMAWTPLACASEGGWVNVARILINAGSDLAVKDRSQLTPLHLAAQKGHTSLVKLLLRRNAPIKELDFEGHNPLDTAIQFGQSDVAMTIIDSDHWREALRNKNPGKKKDYYKTPLRKLIRKMPDVAARVFTRCITYPTEVDVKDRSLEIVFDFEFLDDTYSCSTWGNPALVNIQNHTGKVYDADGLLLPDAKPYTTNPVTREDNHPLEAMVKSNRTELLYHPLVLALVRHKWRLAQISYFSFLFYYIAFVSLFTSYMVLTLPPYMYNFSYIDLLNSSTCDKLSDAAIDSAAKEVEASNGWIFAILVWSLAGIGIIIEILQLYSTPVSYLWNATNVLDWFTYVSACIVVAPVAPCNVKTNWQWQLGAACMFISWVDLILFLRRLPGVGIYIVMVGEVFVTFVKFFLFCFSLFIFAFGFTFYVLLRNQVQFETPAYAFMKTAVMMIGEIDFVDMFHGESDEKVFFEWLTYVVFILFLCMVTIVIMNLLTGLAVGDVQEIQEDAKLKKLAMQVELALDVETSLPEPLRKRCRCVIGRQTIRPNKLGLSFAQKFKRFLSGPLASASIAKVIYSSLESNKLIPELQETNVEEEAAHAARDEHEGLLTSQTPQTTHQKVMAQIIQNKEQLRVLNEKMDRFELLFRTFLDRSNVDMSDVMLTDDAT